MPERGSVSRPGRRTMETRQVEKRLQPTASAQRTCRSNTGRVRQCGHANFLTQEVVCVERFMSYFKAQQAGKIGPRTIHSFPDSTSLLSQNAGQVNPAKCALSECLKLRVQSTTENISGNSRGDDRHNTVQGQSLHEQIQKIGLRQVQRRTSSEQFPSQRCPARLTG